MNKKIVFLIIICILLTLSSYAIIRSRIFKSDMQKPYVLTSSPSSSPTPSLPTYSVEIISPSRIVAHKDAEITLKLTNVSIKPFITKIAVDKCVFSDIGGKKYDGKLFNAETAFEKAILPGESRDATEVNGSVELTGYGIGGEGFIKCDYRDDGTKSCTIVKSDLTVDSCIFLVRSDNGQASNGWGISPIEIQFPE